MFYTQLLDVSRPPHLLNLPTHSESVVDADEEVGFQYRQKWRTGVS